MLQRVVLEFYMFLWGGQIVVFGLDIVGLKFELLNLSEIFCRQVIIGINLEAGLLRFVDIN